MRSIRLYRALKLIDQKFNAFYLVVDGINFILDIQFQTDKDYPNTNDTEAEDLFVLDSMIDFHQVNRIYHSSARSK